MTGFFRSSIYLSWCTAFSGIECGACGWLWAGAGRWMLGKKTYVGVWEGALSSLLRYHTNQSRGNAYSFLFLQPMKSATVYTGSSAQSDQTGRSAIPCLGQQESILLVSAIIDATSTRLRCKPIADPFNLTCRAIMDLDIVQALSNI